MNGTDGEKAGHSNSGKIDLPKKGSHPVDQTGRESASITGRRSSPCSTPIINQTGEKFYTHKDIEIILKIRELLIVEKLDKNKIKEVLKNDLSVADLLEERGGGTHFDKDKINRLRGELKEILTILDKSDKI